MQLRILAVPIIIVIALALGIAIIFQVPIQLFLAVAIPPFLFICMRYTKEIMLGLGVFIIFQDLIAYQFINNPFMHALIKRTDEFAVFIVFAALLLKILHEKRHIRGAGLDIPIALLIITAVTSTMRSRIVPYMVAGFDLFILLKGFMVYYIFLNLDLSEKYLKRFLTVFYIIALFSFLVGLLDVIAPFYIRPWIRNVTFVDYRFGIASALSFFSHPGIFGWFMAISACFSIAFYLIMDKKRYIISYIIFILGTVFSMRIKPMLGLLLASGIVFFLIPLKKKIIFFFILCLCAIFFCALFGQESMGLFQDKVYIYAKSPSISNTARVALYKTGTRIMADYFPFGSGLGTFGGWISSIYYSPIYGKYGLDYMYGLQEGGDYIMDTFWPYIMGQYGIFGLALYTALLILLIRNVYGIFRESKSLSLKAFSLGAFMCLFESIAESIASPIFLAGPFYYFIFAPLGIAGALAIKNKYENKTINSISF